jgi:hypothetical protein
MRPRKAYHFNFFSHQTRDSVQCAFNRTRAFRTHLKQHHEESMFLRSTISLDAKNRLDIPNQKTTLNNGYLGSRNDEERSEMRYVV